MTTMVLWLLAMNPGLEVTVTGLESDAGEVRVALFAAEKGWPQQDELALRRAAVKPSKGVAKVVFDDLPPGTYAVVAFHDADGDGKLKKGLFGVPKEPWGASNGARGALGPSFEAASFALREARKLTLTVKE
jgi:uncharacterized protein (DUF2141 family)